MNKFIYLLFLSVCLLDYVTGKLSLLGRYALLVPEIISIVALLITSALFMIRGGKNIPPKYVFFLILFLLNIVLGIVINTVPPGPIISGFRTYLKYIPFFILPFVYHFSTEQISGQLKFLLSIFLIQAPLALYQRLVLSADLLTGDWVVGTFNGSSILTVMQSCSVAILMSFYLARIISIKTFFILFVLFFIPTTLNESKIAIVLIPTALMMPMLFSSENISFKQYIPMIIIGALAGFAFIAIYDYFMRPRWGYGLLDFFTMEGRTEHYLYKGAEIKGERVGKIDTFVLAIKSLCDNILNLLFGLGIGNVSDSSIANMAGEYADKYRAFNVNGTGLAIVLWEFGLFGALLYYVFYFMVYKDARQLSRHGGLVGALANGWSVVVIIITISTLQTNIIQNNPVSYLFWYFSGYVISECSRHRRKPLNTIENKDFFNTPQFYNRSPT